MNGQEYDEVELHSSEEQHRLSVHGHSSSLGRHGHFLTIGTIDEQEGLTPKAILQKTNQLSLETICSRISFLPSAKVAMVTPAASNAIELQV